MAQLIVSHEAFASAELDSIEMCAVGSSPLAPSTLRALQERMPEASVSNSYGMTEAGPAFCSMPKGEALKRIGSVGKPMPPLEVRIVDDDGSRGDRGRDRRGRAAHGGPPARVLPQPRGHRRGPGRTAGSTAATWPGSTTTATSTSSAGRRTSSSGAGTTSTPSTSEAVLLDHPGRGRGRRGRDPPRRARARTWPPWWCVTGRLHGDGRRAPGPLRRDGWPTTRCPGGSSSADELPRNATGKILKEQLRRH